MKLVIYAVLLEFAFSAFRGLQAIQTDRFTQDKQDYTLQYLNTGLEEINLSAENALEVSLTQREKLLNLKEQEIQQREKLITTQLAEYENKLHDRENEVIKKEVLIEVIRIQNERFRLEELKNIQQESDTEKYRSLIDKEQEIEKAREETKELYEKISQIQYSVAEYEGQIYRRKIELDEKEKHLSDLQNALNAQQGKLEEKEEEINAKVKSEIEQEQIRLAAIQEKQRELDRHREDLIEQWYGVIQYMEEQQTKVRNKQELSAIENIEQQLTIGLEELETRRNQAESFLFSPDIKSKTLQEKIKEFQLTN